MTENELDFYTKLELLFGRNYKVQAQIPLFALVTIEDKNLLNSLFRSIDFGIFDKRTFKPLLMIELNDSSHKAWYRYRRDLEVRDILKEVGIPFITFYSLYINDIDYIKNHVSEELAKYKD